MKIAVFNNKGGVGKTTTVINLAYALAKRPDVTGGVLVADCDRQENAARFLCDNLTESLTDPICLHSNNKLAKSFISYPIFLCD